MHWSTPSDGGPMYRPGLRQSDLRNVGEVVDQVHPPVKVGLRKSVIPVEIRQSWRMIFAGIMTGFRSPSGS